MEMNICQNWNNYFGVSIRIKSHVEGNCYLVALITVLQSPP